MPCMYRQIARLHDARQYAPHIAVHREPETRLMQQGLQVVLVGHRDGFVCRIHPLHRQLQRLPTPHRAHRRGGGEHFLGLDGRISEEGIFGAGGEIGEVGHKNQLLFSNPAVLQIFSAVNSSIKTLAFPFFFSSK